MKNLWTPGLFTHNIYIIDTTTVIDILVRLADQIQKRSGTPFKIKISNPASLFCREKIIFRLYSHNIDSYNWYLMRRSWFWKKNSNSLETHHLEYANLYVFLSKWRMKINEWHRHYTVHSGLHSSGICKNKIKTFCQELCKLMLR